MVYDNEGAAREAALRAMQEAAEIERTGEERRTEGAQGDKRDCDATK